MVSVIEPELEEDRLDRPRRATILVVDDDESQVVALEHRLTQQGFEVLTAFDGRSALEKVRQQAPDLVLLDLRLPDIEGFEICSEMADHPETCVTPVIILSALDRPDIVRSARSAGCEYYVRKPYDPNVLLALIERALLESD